MKSNSVLFLACFGLVSSALGIDCPGSPSNPVNGLWPANCANGTIVPPTTCTALCQKPGFTSPNPPTIQCTSQGWLITSPTDKCEQVCSGAPPPMAVGYWGTSSNANCSDSIEFGATCVGSCPSNYVGTPAIQCLGNWSRTTVVGQCVPLGGCVGRPPAVLNAAWPTNCIDYANGQVCIAQCNDKNILFKPANATGHPADLTATCTAGSWVVNDNAVSCVRVCMGDLPTVDGVTWGDCIGNALPGDICTGTCPGNQTGSPTVRCSFGAWEQPQGGCVNQGGCQGLPPTTLNAEPPTCTFGANGERCYYTCNAGSGNLKFGPSSPEGVYSVCQNGTWSNATNACGRVCVSAPPALSNGVWGNATTDNNCVGAITTGALCRGTCDSAKNYSGSPIVTCLGGGWSTVSGGCAPAGGCPMRPPTAPQNSQLLTACIGAPGERCNYTCNAGTVPSSPDGVYTLCQNGVWTNATATCVRACQSTPPALAGGTWGSAGNNFCVGTVPAGGVCVGTCGNNTEGSPNITCQGSSWSSQSGGCAPIGGCSTAAPTVRNAKPPACTPAPNNGVCTYVCNNNSVAEYAPKVGAAVTSICQSGVWSTPTTTCERVCKTSTLPPLVNGTWGNCALLQAGSLCSGVCFANSFGAPTTQCGGGGSGSFGAPSGGCFNTPVCAGLPTVATKNGGWSAGCNHAAQNTACPIVCNTNFRGNATVACVRNATNLVTGADWATTFTGTMCTR